VIRPWRIEKVRSDSHVAAAASAAQSPNASTPNNDAFVQLMAVTPPAALRPYLDGDPRGRM
jgi:hypothetical protein